MKLIKATIIISLLRLLDMLTTYLCLDKFGTIVEGNPLVRFQVELFGIIGGLIVHYIWTTILLYFIFKFVKYINRITVSKRDMFKIVFWINVVIFSLVPIWNLLNLLI